MKEVKKIIFKSIAILILVLLMFTSMSNLIVTFADTIEAWATKSDSVKISLIDKVANYWNIKTTMSNATVFCIDGGGSLSGYESNPTKYDNIVSLYNNDNWAEYFSTEENYKKAQWLADNAYVTGLSLDQENILKDNLWQIINANKGTYTVKEEDFYKLTDEQLIAIQNCVFWSFSNNYSEQYDNATIYSNEVCSNIVSILKSAANGNYTHSNEIITLSKTQSTKIDTENNTAGPYSITGIDLANISSNDFVLKVNGTQQTTFNITTSGNNNVTFTNLSNLQTESNSINKIEITYKKAYATTASILYAANNQTLLSIKKTFQNVTNLDVEENKLADLALVKTITSYGSKEANRFDPNTDVDTSALDDGNTYAVYNVDKNVITVNVGDYVTYTIYVFNEGKVDGTVNSITDYVPEYLELYKINGKAASNYSYTKNESPAVNNDGVKYNRYEISNLGIKVKGYSSSNGISYGTLQLTFKVNDIGNNDTIILRNYAEISKATFEGVSNDIDSTPNSFINTFSSIIHSYDNKINNIISLINLKKSDSDKGSKYNVQDDDDFEQIKVNKPGIDLALRKYISSINGVYKERTPLLYGYSEGEENVVAYELEQDNDTTIDYIHNKETITVEKGDTITYKIRVYNEGGAKDYNGYATEIVDTIPAGLEFDRDATIEANAENTWINLAGITPYSNTDGSSEVIVAIPAKDISNYNNDDTTGIVLNGLVPIGRYYAEYLNNNDLPKYQEVTIVCKVVNSDEVVGNTLINTASITEYCYFNETKLINVDESSSAIVDRDSTVDSSKDENSHSTIKEIADTRLITGISMNNVPGVQDDDDFESVIVENTVNLGKFQLSILKTDENGNGLQNVTFQIGSGEVFSTNENGEVTKTIGLSKTGEIGQITLKEISTINGYVKLSENIKIYLKAEENDKSEIILSEIGFVTNDLIDVSEVTSEKTITKEVLLEDGRNVEVQLKIAKDDSENPVITLIIPNKPKLNGKYSIKILKVDDTENPISGIQFKIGDYTYTTNEDGIAIKDNDTKDKYTIGTSRVNDWYLGTTIKEIDSGRYIGLWEQIKIYRYTEVEGDKIVVTKFDFDEDHTDCLEVGSNETIQKQYRLINGEKVTVEFSTDTTETGEVTLQIKVENKKHDIGEYNLYIQKIDLDGNIIPNVKFKVNNEETEATNSETGNVLVKTQEMNFENVSNIDTYEISEISTNENKLIKLKDSVTLSVQKYYTDYTGFRVGFASFSGKTQVTALLEDDTEVTINVETIGNDIIVTIPNKPINFDLSLRKFITKINGVEIEESREPEVDISKLASGESTTATYKHSKEVVEVCPSDVVEYTLRVYNEGEKDGYASLIMDDIPDGLEMVKPVYDENGNAANTNALYRWKMYKKADENAATDSEVILYNNENYVLTEDLSEAQLIVTDYLSKENGETMSSSEEENSNLLKAYVSGQDSLSYKDVKVEFKVKSTSDEIIVNYAQITKETDSDGEVIIDRDSTPNKWIETDDDQDIEKIKVKHFDLALYKWVSTVIVKENDIVEEYESGHTQSDKSNLVTVVIKKDDLNKVEVKFKYIIKVENQGSLAGYAKEITDYIPSGLKFVKEDNTAYGWEEQEDGIITTNYLKDTLLEPGETAEVVVVLTWINGENNLGDKINYAEISEDFNDYGDSDDIDSTPGNFIGEVLEDDEDADLVTLQIKTGKFNSTYIMISVAFVTIIASGIVLIKKYAM